MQAEASWVVVELLNDPTTPRGFYVLNLATATRSSATSTGSPPKATQDGRFFTSDRGLETLRLDHLKVGGRVLEFVDAAL